MGLKKEIHLLISLKNELKSASDREQSVRRITLLNCVAALSTAISIMERLEEIHEKQN